MSEVLSGIISVAVQPDGKILIAGDFTAFDGVTRGGIARLNVDGSVDTSFAPTGTNVVYSVAVQSDGKILIAGFSQLRTNFTNFTRPLLARLRPDGSVDNSFNVVTDSNGSFLGVHVIAIQPNNRILIGGNFSRVNSTPRSQIARINSDGTLDLEFDPSAGVNSGINWVGSIEVQRDGKIFIGGNFRAVNGTNRYAIARLNANGSLDLTFDANTPTNSTVDAIAIQPDGKVIVGSDIRTRRGGSKITRFNDDGSRDESFKSSDGISDEVNAIALQPNGKVLIGGRFTEVNQIERSAIARLDADGKLDLSFDPGAGANDSVSCIAVQRDGEVLIGGAFTLVNGANRRGIARLNTNGSLDDTFDPGSGISPYPSSAWNGVASIVIQPDTKIIVGGYFNAFDGTNRTSLVRLNANGSMDPEFNPILDSYASIHAVVLQPDGKILVAGAFYSINGVMRRRIGRINADGTVDTTFDPGLGPDGFGGDTTVYSLALQTDGRILVGGRFTAFNGTNRFGIARLNANGSLDCGFDPGVYDPDKGSPGRVYCIAVEPDGKMIVGGRFQRINQIARRGIARLNPEGSVDTTFGSSGDGINGRLVVNEAVTSLALQANSKILFGGDFSTVQSTPRAFIARIEAREPSPAITIERTGVNIALSWPAPFTTFVLQRAIDPRTSIWEDVTNGLFLHGDTWVVTNLVDATQGYYRLRRR